MTVTSSNIPDGRGRWRITLHHRPFSSGDNFARTVISELPGAFSRRLEQKLNQPAQLAFSIDGRAPEAALLQELQTDVVAWRFDDSPAQMTDWPAFRGVVSQTEDVVSEQRHTVNVVAHDYLAVLNRRYMTQNFNWVNVNQDTLCQYIIQNAGDLMTSSSGVSLSPGSYLPFIVRFANPDGSGRPQMQGVPVRTRNYLAQSSYGKMWDELAHVAQGFDYACAPSSWTSPDGSDLLSVYFPQQGVTRTDTVLEYGGAVASLTRSVNSADYANYVRVVGNAPSDTAPPMYSETWDVNTAPVSGVGLWQDVANAPDVSDQGTLDAQAQGQLNLQSILVPSYSLALVPGFYRRGLVNMGDTVPLVIRSGRLNVSNAAVRIVGMTFAISDDGSEDVQLTVGRPPTTLADMLSSAAYDIDALARR